ncbi:hypothetical protein VUR80DRAFT_5489 [Thermomyces stellatus]
MHTRLAALALAGLAAGAPWRRNETETYAPAPKVESIQLGPRPYFLVDTMRDGPLKDKLESCKSIDTFEPSSWSIAHRGGGTLQIPEHTVESNLAGARMGAGVLECDVAFTSDRQLVCRHSQCDLHFTTDILTRPELNAKCTKPFSPATDDDEASALCCTSDITLDEFKSLCGKMDGSNTSATTPEDFSRNTEPWRTDLYATCGTVLTHREHIELTKSLGLKFAPELKTPEVDMPFEGEYTQEQYAQDLVDEYKAAGVDPSDVYLQSFLYNDILYWLENEPDFNVVYNDDTGETEETMPDAIAALEGRADDGLKILGPPMNYLVAVEDGKIVPSEYAEKAMELGFDILSWSAERSGPLKDGGDYYFMPVKDVVDRDGDLFEVLHVLAQEIGVLGVFSDWSATTTYYANCFGLF